MTTLAEVLFALHDRVKEALPTTIVKMNEPLAEGFNTPGQRYVDIGVGDPDEGYPQKFLGGPWVHRRVIVVVVSVQNTDDDKRTQELLGMVQSVAGGLSADRRLGGLATTLEVMPPEYAHTGQGDAPPLGQASLGVMVEYQSESEVE